MPLLDTCIYCRLVVVDDGEVLVDTTGGDACGVPLDNGAEHSHCRGYAPDVWGTLEDVCIECFCHKIDHPDTN